MTTHTDFQDWIGREEVRTETISPDIVARMAATLDVDSPGAGATLPLGWQWLFFNPVAPTSLLGTDGHPERGNGSGILPPVPLERRMWAGSRVEYLSAFPVGALATRRSTLQSVVFKDGRAGRMCFVTVLHQLEIGKQVVIREEQDIVYKPAAPVNDAATAVVHPHASEDVPDADIHELHKPDVVLLFRYSALTFNGHRIHYDLPYATGVEGYAGLVVHGPLTATLVQGFAQRAAGARRLTTFAFKATQPLYAGDELHLRAWREGGGLTLKAFNAKGALVMQAKAGLEAV